MSVSDFACVRIKLKLLHHTLFSIIDYQMWNSITGHHDMLRIMLVAVFNFMKYFFVVQLCLSACTLQVIFRKFRMSYFVVPIIETCLFLLCNWWRGCRPCIVRFQFFVVEFHGKLELWNTTANAETWICFNCVR